jgi:hypothetical protein
MSISDRALEEFIKIYEDEFGDRLARPEASDIAERLLALYRLLLRKVPDEQNSTPVSEADDKYDR